MGLAGKLPVIIAGVIMAASFVGMIICAKKQQTTPAAKPLAVVFMGFVMVCALVILWKTGIFGDTSVKGFIKNEMIYNRSAGFVLGKYLAEKVPGSKVLIVVDNVPNQVQNEQVAALKEASAGKLTIVSEDMPTPVQPPPNVEGDGSTPAPEEAPAPAPQPPPDSGEMLSIRETMKAVDFDAMIARHADCNLIISFLGLPVDVESMTVWEQPDPAAVPDAANPTPIKPKIAVINADIYKLKNAIQGNAVVAAVTYSPNAKFDEASAPSNPQAAFDRRYILITPENVEQISTQFGGIFEKAP